MRAAAPGCCPVVPEMVSKNVQICNQINTLERVCPVPVHLKYPPPPRAGNCSSRAGIGDSIRRNSGLPEVSMHGTMMEYPLVLTAFLERAGRLFRM